MFGAEPEKAGPVLQRMTQDLLLMLQRMFRAALLDGLLYQEVAASRAATGQAFLIVVLVAVATANAFYDEGEVTWLEGLRTGLVVVLVGWVAWTSIIFLVEAKPESTDGQGWTA